MSEDSPKYVARRTAAPCSTDGHGKDLVYGRVAKSLVFVPVEQARELATTWEALRFSTTWGEFRKNVSPKRYQHVLHLAGCGPADTDDPVPAPTAAFAGPDLGAVADGDYPEWTAQEMLRWMPREILDSPCSQIQPSFLNGSCLVLDPSRVGEIVGTLQAAGFRCLLDEDLVLRASGWEPRKKWPGRSVSEWIEALGSDDGDEMESAVEALLQDEDVAVPALLLALKTGNPLVRPKAAETLGKIRPVRTEVVTALVKALDDAGETVVASAQAALGEIGPDAAPAVPALLKTLEHSNPRIWKGAVRALGRIGPDASPAVPAIAGLLTSTNNFVLLAAAEALGNIGAGAATATPALQEAIRRIARSKDSFIVTAMVHALIAIGNAGSSALGELLEDRSSEVRSMASRAMNESRVGRMPTSKNARSPA